MAGPVIPSSKERRSLVGKLARASSSRHPNDADVHELKRELKAAYLRDAIRELADTFPPLSPEQKSELALLLRGSNAKNSAAA